MNLAQLVQSQNFARLLQALDAAGELSAGKTVAARLISLDADGTATAAIGDARVALVLAGPQAQQAALQPGATLMLRLEAPEQAGGDLRATLVEIRPPAANQLPAQATTAPAPQPSPAPASLPAAQPSSPPTPSASAPPVTLTQPRTTSAPTLEATTLPISSPPGQRLPQAIPPSALPASVAPPAALRAAVEVAIGRASQPGIAVPAPALIQGSPAPAGTAPLATAARQAMAAETSQPLAGSPVSPRAAIGPTLGAALMRQDSLAPLFANLRGLAEGNVTLALPKPLQGAVEQVLRQAFPADRQLMTGPRLQAALQSSGLLMEAHAAGGQAPAPQSDLKAGLLALRETLLPLVAALSPESSAAKQERPSAPLPESAADSRSPVPPPRRDGALSPQAAAEPTLAPGEKPLAIAMTLLDQTDAALDRIKLTQYASLPLDAPRTDPTQPQPQRWLTEIPLAFQHGTAVLPLQVEKDPPRREVQSATAPLWRIRFALDVEPMGPLQGVVTLQGREVGVTLWAEREETSKLLRGAAPGLESALLHADFTGGAVDVHTGQPRVMQPTAGQFLDRLS